MTDTRIINIIDIIIFSFFVLGHLIGAILWALVHIFYIRPRRKRKQRALLDELKKNNK